MVQLLQAFAALLGTRTQRAFRWQSLAAYPLAVCNDGTPAGYYWREGAKDSHTWLVYLAGGNWCFNEKDCIARCPPPGQPEPYPGLCSSVDYPETQDDFGGVFSPTSPKSALAGAHMAYIMYCTSDGHMGDGEAWGLQFRGARVVESVFKDLVRNHELAQGERELVILGGVSAGARGAMVNLDYVPDFLANARAPGATKVEVVGLLDSPLWVDIPPLIDSGFVGFRRSCRNVQRFANVTRFGKECAKAFPEKQRFKCLMGQYRMPFLGMPYLLVAAQYDSFQLSNNIGVVTDQKTIDYYVDEFSNRTVSLVRDLTARWSKSAARQNAVYSPACFTHARTGTSEGFSLEQINGVTIENALDQFLNLAARTERRPLEWIDGCNTIDCGSGCPTEAGSMVPAGCACRRPLFAFVLISLVHIMIIVS
mmetsp:Transcript_136884/g.381578  ORF Transcript_136884/g.381578 Transcript_136884/m.381578 type:complete len:423 (+) Transcript_136884:94-1362(+)